MPEATASPQVALVRARWFVPGVVAATTLGTALLLGPPSGAAPGPPGLANGWGATPSAVPSRMETDARAAAAPAVAGSPAPPPPGVPVRVAASAVGLDSGVIPVGVTDKGDVAVPADPARAGWYRFGPAPGATQGSAVLVGHVDNDDGDIGEFAALYDIRAGDSIEVEVRPGNPPGSADDRKGAGTHTLDYRVTGRFTVAKEQLPDAVFRRRGTPVLTLITCAPPFDRAHGGYRNNLVVTAVPVV